MPPKPAKAKGAAKAPAKAGAKAAPAKAAAVAKDAAAAPAKAGGKAAAPAAKKAAGKAKAKAEAKASAVEAKSDEVVKPDETKPDVVPVPSVSIVEDGERVLTNESPDETGYRQVIGELEPKPAAAAVAATETSPATAASEKTTDSPSKPVPKPKSKPDEKALTTNTKLLNVAESGRDETIEQAIEIDMEEDEEERAARKFKAAHITDMGQGAYVSKHKAPSHGGGIGALAAAANAVTSMSRSKTAPMILEPRSLLAGQLKYKRGQTFTNEVMKKYHQMTRGKTGLSGGSSIGGGMGGGMDDFLGGHRNSAVLDLQIMQTGSSSELQKEFEGLIRLLREWKEGMGEGNKGNNGKSGEVDHSKHTAEQIREMILSGKIDMKDIPKPPAVPTQPKNRSVIDELGKQQQADKNKTKNTNKNKNEPVYSVDVNAVFDIPKFPARVAVGNQHGEKGVPDDKVPVVDDKVHSIAEIHWAIRNEWLEMFPVGEGGMQGEGQGKDVETGSSTTAGSDSFDPLLLGDELTHWLLVVESLCETNQDDEYYHKSLRNGIHLSETIDRLELCLDRVKSWNLLEHLVLEEDSVSTVGVDQAVTLLQEQQKTVLSQLKHLKVVLERLVDVNSVKVYDGFEKVPKDVLEDFGRKAELCAGGSVRVEAREKVSVVYRFYVQTASEDLLVYKTSVSPEADTTTPDGRNDVFRFPEIDITSTTTIAAATPSGGTGAAVGTASTTLGGGSGGAAAVPGIELPRDHPAATQCLMGPVLELFLKGEVLGRIERKEIESLTLEGSFLEDGCDCGGFGGRMMKLVWPVLVRIPEPKTQFPILDVKRNRSLFFSTHDYGPLKALSRKANLESTLLMLTTKSNEARQQFQQEVQRLRSQLQHYKGLHTESGIKIAAAHSKTKQHIALKQHRNRKIEELRKENEELIDSIKMVEGQVESLKLEAGELASIVKEALEIGVEVTEEVVEEKRRGSSGEEEESANNSKEIVSSKEEANGGVNGVNKGKNGVGVNARVNVVGTNGTNGFHSSASSATDQDNSGRNNIGINIGGGIDDRIPHLNLTSDGNLGEILDPFYAEEASKLKRGLKQMSAAEKLHAMRQLERLRIADLTLRYEQQKSEVFEMEERVEGEMDRIMREMEREKEEKKSIWDQYKAERDEEERLDKGRRMMLRRRGSEGSEMSGRSEGSGVSGGSDGIGGGASQGNGVGNSVENNGTMIRDVEKVREKSPVRPVREVEKIVFPPRVGGGPRV